MKLEAEIGVIEQKNAGSHQKLEQTRNEFSVRFLGRASPMQHLGFSLPASNIVREILIVLRQKV